jgi:DNA-binding beta-propeller fold protein YncE
LTNINRACKQYQIDLTHFISTNTEFSEKEQIKIELEFSSSQIQSLKNEITKIGYVSLKESMLECDSKLNEQSFNTIELIENKFWCPSGVKFNFLTNEIFVADTYNRQIKILDYLNGELLRCHELSYVDKLTLKDTRITPRDLHFNSSGLLIVTDSSNHKCHFLDSVNFQVINSFGEKGHERGQFMNPRGVCFDQFNRIYVCDRGKLFNSFYIINFLTNLNNN